MVTVIDYVELLTAYDTYSQFDPSGSKVIIETLVKNFIILYTSLESNSSQNCVN